VPHATQSCQLTHAQPGDSRGNSPHQSDTPIHITPADQWISTTTGRIATDPYSWMQAVHWIAWIAESGLYKPTRTHGPGWGPTTVFIAQEISALSECRPGVDYLARKLKCSERTVQYHLGMLREAGLLAYRSKGTRLSGLPNQASLFERIIPAAFDAALGIRTTGEGVQRRPVGISPESRTTIAKLAKKAIRKVRRTTRKRTRSGGLLCTPMEGGTSASSSTGTSTFPSESKRASGKKSSPTPKQRKRGPRKLNTVGRRYQLARELITLLPWMSRATIRPIAWVIRHVADAGWTADEIRALLDLTPISDTVHRPSGYLARRLTGAHDLWNTPGRRRQLLDDWRDTKRATAARHTEWAGSPEPGTSPRLVAQFMAGLDQGKAAYADRQAALGLDNLNNPTNASTTDAAADFAAFFASADLTGAF
jgi:hypothetical protein